MYLQKIKPFSLLLFLTFAFTLPSDEGLNKIILRFQDHHRHFQQEKVYLHLDKPVYANGEDIWFKAYLVDASLHLPDTISKVLYVELINTNQQILKRVNLPVINGTAVGDFALEDSIREGNYLIRAYTNNMKNFDEEFFFTKEIVIVNPLLLPETAIAEKPAITVQFFPEGGQLVAGLENRVAFKATNQNGLGVDVEGEIIDNSDSSIVTFKSKHLGMGSLNFIPKAGKSYHAVIRKENENVKFPIPAVEATGFILKVVDAGKNIKLSVFNNYSTISKSPRKVFIVAQSRGVVSVAAEALIDKSYLNVLIPKEKFPTGIGQITLFDDHYVPLLERIFFVNHCDQLACEIHLNKEKFKKRDSVVMDLMVTSKKGNNGAGNFSISVFDSKNIKTSENYPSSIVSYLLLSSDIKGKIESPGYYFKDTLPERSQHLDLLMMTQGWRRFSWKKILKDTLEERKHYPEKGIVISGTVFKTLPKRPAAASQVKVVTKDLDIIVATTDKKGEFYINSLNHFDSLEMAIQTDNSKGKKAALDLQLNPFTPSPKVVYRPSPYIPVGSTAFLENNKNRNNVLSAIRFDKMVQLKEVEVTAKRQEEHKESSPFYGTPDASVKMSEVSSGYTDIFQILSGRVAGLFVSGAYPNVSVQIRGGGMPLFLLDGMPIELQDIGSISPSFVDRIDILMGASAGMYGGRGGNGVIAIYTKRGEFNVGRTIGIQTVKYPGYYKARDFYSPNYAVSSKDDERPDLRSALFWKPNETTDASGKSKIVFYTSDISSTFKIVMEGISEEGLPLYSEKEFVVED